MLCTGCGNCGNPPCTSGSCGRGGEDAGVGGIDEVLMFVGEGWALPHPFVTVVVAELPVRGPFVVGVGALLTEKPGLSLLPMLSWSAGM